jgi:hypothetical protein
MSQKVDYLIAIQEECCPLSIGFSPVTYNGRDESAVGSSTSLEDHLIKIAGEIISKLTVKGKQ